MLLALLQLSDSSFPTGSHAHSFGLEWLYARGEVDLESVLRVRLSQSLARLELPFVRAAFGCEPDSLQHLDRTLDALQPVKELRDASRSIGHSLLRASLEVGADEVSERALALGLGHQPIVFGLVARAWGLDLGSSLEAYTFQSVRQQLSAAQRLGKIGQRTVQRMLKTLRPAMTAAVERARTLPVDETGAFSPFLDIAGIRHRQQFARVFLS